MPSYIYLLPHCFDVCSVSSLANPYETKSDSFYFVNDKLIMHNKAEYRYTENSIEAQGKANSESIDFSQAGSKSNDGGATKTTTFGDFGGPPRGFTTPRRLRTYFWPRLGA